MKVFNLACGHDHRFEGWFGSADDYERQLERKLVECPICGDSRIRRLPSAPRLNLSGVQKDAADSQRSTVQAATEGQEKGMRAQGTPTPEQLQALWMQLARQLVEQTEDVGKQFAEEARRIHYKEAPERGIRGVATSEEREALEDEGIQVFSFPLPRSMKDPVQ